MLEFDIRIFDLGTREIQFSKGEKGLKSNYKCLAQMYKNIIVQKGGLFQICEEI